MEPPTQRRAELPALTGVRFVAALAVVGVHLRGHLAALLPATAPMDPWLQAGRLGVDLFFVLSGFVLAYHYLDAFRRPTLAGYRRFVRQRLARIYPLHLLTLALLALFVGVRGAAGRPVANLGDYGLGDLLANVALVQCWTLRDCGSSWNGPAWSLSAEWFAYLAFPLVALAVTRIRRRAGLAGAIGLTVLAQLWLAEVAHLDGGIPRIAATFTLGALLARLHLDGAPRADWGPVALWTATATPLLAMALASAGHSPGLVVPLFGLLVLALANAPDSGLGRALSTPRMLFWGQASYALYVTHAVVLAVAAEFIRLDAVAQASLPVRLALLAGYVMAMLIVAAVAFREVAEPYRLIGRGARRRPAPVLVPAPARVPTPALVPSPARVPTTPARVPAAVAASPRGALPGASAAGAAVAGGAVASAAVASAAVAGAAVAVPLAAPLATAQQLAQSAPIS